MATIEQAVGIGIMLLFLTDIFVTVLYARANAGILAPRLGRLIWRVFRVVGGSLGRPADVLSFCGPAILITAVAFWAFGLTLGAALIIHPELGHGVVSGSGETGTDFLTALEAGGASLAIVGAGDHSPAAASMQLLYLFDSLIGVSVLSLTLTYLMQVYTALRERNVVAMDLHLLTAETDDAAELLVRLAPDGDPGRAVDALAQLGGRITAGKEAHHFYPSCRGSASLSRTTRSPGSRCLGSTPSPSSGRRSIRGARPGFPSLRRSSSWRADRGYF
jgi:hypothetical protein